MQVGDRVRVNEPRSRAGLEGVIVEPYTNDPFTRNAWWVRTDEGRRIDQYENQLEVIPNAPVESQSVKGDVLEMAQRNRDAMLNEIAEFRKAAEAGTLGNFSELGFLYHLLQALTKD